MQTGGVEVDVGNQCPVVCPVRRLRDPARQELKSDAHGLLRRQGRAHAGSRRALIQAEEKQLRLIGFQPVPVSSQSQRAPIAVPGLLVVVPEECALPAQAEKARRGTPGEIDALRPEEDGTAQQETKLSHHRNHAFVISVGALNIRRPAGTRNLIRSRAPRRSAPADRRRPCRRASRGAPRAGPPGGHTGIHWPLSGGRNPPANGGQCS